VPVYRFGDLVVASEIALIQLPTIDGAPVECTLSIRPAEVVERSWNHTWRRADGTTSLACAREGNDYVLGFPGWGTARIRDDGRVIEVRPAAGLPHETIEHLINDQLLPRVAAFRGRLVLHAGCVVTAGGACAFLGDSGSGKSTLCAGFVREGDLLLGDDGIFVRRGASGGFEAEATYPGLRLLPHPIEELWGDDLPAAPVSHDTAKRRLPLGAGGAFPLRALYVLDGPAPGDAPDGVQAAVLPPREGFVALLRSTFQLHLGDPARTRRLFEQLSELLDEVPVRTVRYARRLDLLPGIRHEVLRDLTRTILPG
jgi:hypothetical protein